MAKIIWDANEHRLMQRAKWIVVVTAIFFVMVFVWMLVAKIDIAVTGNGEVVPVAKIRKIQSADGGVIQKVFVKNHQHVHKGQMLVSIEAVRQQADENQLRVRIAELTAEVARHKSAAHFETSVSYANDFTLEHPNIVSRQNNIFSESRLAYLSKMKILQKNYKIASEEYAILYPLVKKKIVSRLELLKAERTVNELKGNIAKLKHDYSEKAFTELAKARRELSETEQALQAVVDKTDKTQIVSPVDGIINDLNFSAAGEVVRPGELLMDVIPTDKNLAIEARIAPQDVAFIKDGQRVIVRVSAYDFTVYGGLDGYVTSVSPNTVLHDDDRHYFTIMIKTHKNYLLSGQRRLYITPGMTVNVQVITGKQSIMTYLLKPIMRVKSEALRES